MKEKLMSAALAAGRAFVGGAVVAFAGLSYLPNLNGTFALGVAITVGGVGAVVKLIQEKYPSLSTRALLEKLGAGYLAPYADAFLQAFIGAVVTFTLSVLQAPNLSLSQSAAVGALTGAVTAGVRAAQGLITKGEFPFKTVGA